MNAKSDLFEIGKTGQEAGISKNAPLALKMRPRNLDEFVGQEHVLGQGKLLRRLIESHRISSLILYGPSGTGKSALGYIISKLTNSEFDSVHAAAAGVKEVKEKLLTARKLKKSRNIRTILFVDEIHRFNKAQQDVFLDDVELGNIILIGATTHNPFFYIVPALISRSHVFEFKPHTPENILSIVRSALKDKEKGLGALCVEAEKEALEHICLMSNGDARRALNALEVGVLTIEPDINGKIYFSKKIAEESIQKRIVCYDKDEDKHYDVISAFIKSMRGTDPDAALYWMAKMLYAGEDPRFIARRILICASEDVGNADPQALVLANAAFQAVEVLGMPESRIILGQAAVYVACAPKSNAAYLGVEKALHDIANAPNQDVPDHLKDASYKSAKKLAHGLDYKYAHDFENHFVLQEYMKIQKKYYQPSNMGYEKKIKAWLEYLKAVEK